MSTEPIYLVTDAGKPVTAFTTRDEMKTYLKRRLSHARSPDDDAQLIRGYLWVPVSQCEIKRWQIQDWIRPWVRITYNNDVVEHLDF